MNDNEIMKWCEDFDSYINKNFQKGYYTRWINNKTLYITLYKGMHLEVNYFPLKYRDLKVIVNGFTS